MLPDICVVNCRSSSLTDNDIRRHQSASSPSSSDSAVFVHQNASSLVTGDLFHFDPERRQLCIRHLLIVQDRSVPLPLARLMRTFDRRTLTTLYVVDCRFVGDLDDDLLDGVCLRTLVLSGTQLRRLPASLFRSSASTCDVLKVDRNRLSDIPPELSRLGALRTFCCDSQRPRLRSLPTAAFSRLTQLEVLSFADNRISDISSLPAAVPQLRVLLCQRNRIARLPDDLVSLERLRVLNVSYNRLRQISASLLSLVAQLSRLEFFNSSLRPAHLRRADPATLTAHLQLESRLCRHCRSRFRRRPSSDSVSVTVTDESLPPPPRPSTSRSVVERDITIAVVGASRAGKTTLADAMAASGGSCGPLGSLGRRSNTPAPPSSSHGFSARQFDVMQQDGSVCQVNVLVLSADDILNEYVRQISIDLFLLAFDVSALDPGGQPVNGTRSSTRQPFARLQMWLQALYELDPDCRVVLVGTHADRVQAERLSDIWRRVVDGLLDPARPHHVLRTAAATSASRRRCSCSNCLLCRPKYLAVRHAEEAAGSTSPPDTGSLGHGSGTSPAAMTVDPRAPHITGFVDLSLPVGNGAVKANATNGHVASGGDRPAARALRFPHIVGYYETDSAAAGRPSFHRDKDPATTIYENVRCKPTSPASLSVERLVAAILRLAVAPSGDHNETHIAPSNWLKLSRLLAAFVSNTPSSYAYLPLVGVSEVMDQAKLLEMDEEETTLALRYLHRRGLVVFAPGVGDPCQLSTRFICVGSTWFVQTVQRALSSLAVSMASRDELARSVERELTVQAQQRQRQSLRLSSVVGYSSSNVGATQPTAAALHVAQQWLLDAIRDVGVGLTLSGASDPLYLFPALLDTGAPGSDVWPDVPDCGEKQVTCEFRIRSLRPGFFADVVTRVADVGGGRELGRLRTVQLPPLPVFLAEHVVFACMCDVAGCDDCRDIRATASLSESTTCVTRVHIALVSELDVVRVQVRSADGACCVMRAVLDFIDLHLDDLPDDRHMAETCNAEDVSSVESLPSYTSVYDPDMVALGAVDDDDDEDERQYFLLCPKCVLLHLEGPDRIRAHRRTSTSFPPRRPVCARWHHLGSWTRAAIGDYRTYAVGIGSGGGGRVAVCTSALPDYEYPRLVLVLPPSVSAAVRDWYLFARASFVEDVDIHLLCENPAYWHFVDGSVFRIRPQPSGAASAPSRGRSMAAGGRPVPIQLVALAAAVLRVVACGQSGRLVGSVISELVRTCGQLFPPVDFDLGVVGGDEGRERVAAMLGWILTAVGGPPVVDVPRSLTAADSANELSVVESAVFQAPAKGSRKELARLLRAHDAGERFGVLRAVAVGHEVRWVCERHFVELRRICMPAHPSHGHRR